MFPVTIEGITYPCFYNSQSKAMAAATDYFEALGKNNYDYHVLRASTSSGNVYFVLKDKHGDALDVQSDE